MRFFRWAAASFRFWASLRYHYEARSCTDIHARGWHDSVDFSGLDAFITEGMYQVPTRQERLRDLLDVMTICRIGAQRRARHGRPRGCLFWREALVSLGISLKPRLRHAVFADCCRSGTSMIRLGYKKLLWSFEALAIYVCS